MKRLLIGVALTAALLMAGPWRTHHRVRTGEWNGRTAQGLPIDFLVGDSADGLQIQEWRMRLDLECEKTGRVIHAGVASSIPIEIRDDGFALDLRLLGLWALWSGSFRPGDEANGEVGGVWAALDGWTSTS